jgi:hypothetical protein
MTQRIRWRGAPWHAAACALFLCGCASTTAPVATAVPEQSGLDGLESRTVGGFDALFVRPGVDFAAYRAVMIEPLQVTFDDTWDPNRAPRDVSSRLTDSDIQAIKDDMARQFREIFVEELTAGGYRVVEQVGAGTLRIVPEVVDVYINAPDTMSAGRSSSYTMDAGSMTLRLAARDGSTGQLLARVVDEATGIDTGTLRLTNAVTNTAEYRRAVRSWAHWFRGALDRVHGKAG